MNSEHVKPTKIAIRTWILYNRNFIVRHDEEALWQILPMSAQHFVFLPVNKGKKQQEKESFNLQISVNCLFTIRCLQIEVLFLSIAKSISEMVVIASVILASVQKDLLELS